MKPGKEMDYDNHRSGQNLKGGIENKRFYHYMFWSLWLFLTLLLCSYFYYAVSSVTAGDASLGEIFLPGESTNGHHQIEMACTTCHTQPFGGKEIIQNACVRCHAAELEKVDDSHPIKKFLDPRNIEILSKLDARYCITCHTEHRPAVTSEMGVTLPGNLCIQCHADIGEERVTHRNLDFNTCATGGCHNYHDNKALYEKFLLKHRDDANHLNRQRLDERDLLAFLEASDLYPVDKYPLEPLTPVQADAPQAFLISPAGHDADLFATKHADAGVNCSACHQAKHEKVKLIRWTDKPDHTVCLSCHSDETKGFLEGKHGMRLAVGLSPVKPELARLPMKRGSHGREVNCMSCHATHRFDTQKAATTACLQCHDDSHSKNYLNSPHAKLWDKEVSGLLPAGSGVSCATCHLPRIWHENEEEIERILVDHNQNNTLRPNEKMLRPVCLQCHGLEFSMDALADSELIKNNFHGRPEKHVGSIDMALEAERLHREKKEKENK